MGCQVWPHKKDDVYSPWHWLDNRGECFIHQQGVPRYRNKGIRTGTKAGGVYQISKGQQSTALLDELDAFIALLAAKPDILMMNTKMLTKIRAAARRAGYYDRTKNDFGNYVETYNGIALLDAGQYYDGAKTVDVVDTTTPTESAYGTTSIYAAKLGLYAFHGISVDGSKMLKTYLPDLSAPGAVKKGEVELIAGAVLKNSKMAGKLSGIKILDKKAA